VHKRGLGECERKTQSKQVEKRCWCLFAFCLSRPFSPGKKERWGRCRDVLFCPRIGSGPFEREQAFDLVRLFGSCLSSSQHGSGKAYDRRESCSSLRLRVLLRTRLVSKQPLHPPNVGPVSRRVRGWIRQMHQCEDKDAQQPDTLTDEVVRLIRALPPVRRGSWGWVARLASGGSYRLC
jgi:hypothetical protein